LPKVGLIQINLRLTATEIDFRDICGFGSCKLICINPTLGKVRQKAEYSERRTARSQ
jgi:hypothetical protein